MLEHHWLPLLEKKMWMIKGVVGCSFCHFCGNFIYITETREYWKYWVDKKLSHWNSEFNFACSVNFIISLSKCLQLWLRAFVVSLNVWFKLYQELLLVTIDNLYHLYFFPLKSFGGSTGLKNSKLQKAKCKDALVFWWKNRDILNLRAFTFRKWHRNVNLCFSRIKMKNSMKYFYNEHVFDTFQQHCS